MDKQTQRVDHESVGLRTELENDQNLDKINSLYLEIKYASGKYFWSYLSYIWTKNVKVIDHELPLTCKEPQWN